MKIGVFDSGIGGKAIANRLQHDFPQAEVIYVEDHEHVPYGGRPLEEIMSLTNTAVQPLIEQACDVIVLACNTATAAAIESLREKYPHVPFVGLEPMVKPAALQSKSGTFAVFATPFTLSSERYKKLKEKYAPDATILEPDCSNWAAMIEHNQTDDVQIEAIVNGVCEAGADVIVLACTHYHWIKEKITTMAHGRATVIDPSEAISRRVAEITAVKTS
jgi:glutamate racemase